MREWLRGPALSVSPLERRNFRALWRAGPYSLERDFGGAGSGREKRPHRARERPGRWSIWKTAGLGLSCSAIVANSDTLRQIDVQLLRSASVSGQLSQQPDAASVDMLICTVIAAAGTAMTAGVKATQRPSKSAIMRLGVHSIMKKL
jgi:hypothetical protein